MRTPSSAQAPAAREDKGSRHCASSEPPGPRGCTWCSTGAYICMACMVLWCPRRCRVQLCQWARRRLKTACCRVETRAAVHGVGRASAMHYHDGRPWKEGRRSRLRLRQCLCVGLPCSCPPRARTHGGPLELVRPGSASRSSSDGAGSRRRRRGEARRVSRDCGGFGRRRGSGRCMRRVGAWALEQERA